MTDTTTGRVAVITGASSGIGAGTARSPAAEGYRVVLLARRQDRTDALAEQIGAAATAIAADVTDRDSLVAAARRVCDELGGADVLVNNAGTMLLGPFSPEQRWSESLCQEPVPDVRVTLIEPGVVATELPTHITHEATRAAVQQGYDVATVQPEEIAFVLSRPWHLVINEVLLRPADQQG